MNNDNDACRSLYRAARLQERASQGDRHAVRVALAAAISAGVHAAAVGASAASLASVAPAAAGTGAQAASVVASAVGTKGILQLVLGGKFLSGLMVGAALGTAGLATVIAVRPTAPASRVMVQQSVRQNVVVPARVHRAEPPPGDLPVAEVAEATSPQQPIAQQPVAQQAIESAAVVPALRDPAPRRAAAVLSAAESGVPMSEQQRLTDETMALANVQDALSRGDSDRALAMLDEQKQRFASGQLGEERAAANILALCGAGRTVEANVARTNFLAQYPNSPLTKRVNSGCDH